MSLDFAIDLPHPRYVFFFIEIDYRSEYDKEVRERTSNKLNAEYVNYFDEMYKTYCKHHSCHFFSES